MKRLACCVAALLVLALVWTQASAVRDDQAQPPRKFWRFDFKHSGLHYIRVGGRAVAYTTYLVKNDTGAPRIFAPIFRVETETGRLTYAVPSPGVLPAIRRKHGAALKDINEATRVMKQGESLTGVAVFHRLDPQADHVKLYITGLTDCYRYQDEDNRKGYQRQVRHVHWFRPGDGADRPGDRVDTLYDGWVWRSVGTAATAPEEK